MAREKFIDNLRIASQMLPASQVQTERDRSFDAYVSGVLDSADPWLTAKSVEGFDPTDFADLPKHEQVKLARAVDAFKVVAHGVPPDKPASRGQRKAGRRHLEGIIRIIRSRLLDEWLDAQNQMLQVATAAAKSKGWYVEKDEKTVRESLLGTYRAPRLRIRSLDREVVLDPVARFGSGRRGIVDLVILPTYETACLITFKNGDWRISPLSPNPHARRFTSAELLNTIARLPHP